MIPQINQRIISNYNMNTLVFESITSQGLRIDCCVLNMAIYSHCLNNKNNNINSNVIKNNFATQQTVVMHENSPKTRSLPTSPAEVNCIDSKILKLPIANE